MDDLDALEKAVEKQNRRRRGPPFEAVLQRKAKAYIRGVQRGQVPVGELVAAAVERHVRDLRDGPARGLKFSEPLARHALASYQFCRHSKGEWAGQIFDPAGWQCFITWCLFGWVWADTGFRRFTTAFVTVARKNGKSTDAAQKGLYLFAGDNEPGAEVYTAATKRDQARIVHSEASRMVVASPELSADINVWRDNLSIPGTASKYEPLGADADTHDGLNPHAVILDELHAHKDRRQYDVLWTGMGARRQPMMYIITTAGANRESICFELDNYSSQVVRGALVDDSWFAYVARPDPGDDWRDEATWHKGNPNLGVSVYLENLRKDFRKATESLAAQNSFRRLRLNMWTQQIERAIDMEKWDACSAAPKVAEGASVYLGLDLSSKIDVTAAASVHHDVATDEYHAEMMFWVPEATLLERVRRDRVPYDEWADAGFVTVTPGNVVDQGHIRDWINEHSTERQVQEIGFDPWNATKLAQELQDEDGFTLVEMRQGYKTLSEPTKALVGLVLDRRLRHGGNPVLRWMADNLELRKDPNDNWAPKKGARVNRIDGMLALIMALGRALLHANGPSVYENRGLLTIG